MSRVQPNRCRLLRRPALVALPVFLGLPFVAVALFSGFGWSSPESEPMTCDVTRGTFLHEVSVRGQVESAINVEVRCEVRSPDYWMTILEVVPEGTRVKPRDFLIRLDSSALEDQLDQQKIQCEQSKAMVAAAREAYRIAQQEERAYLEGEYRLARQQIEVAILLAEDKLRRAEQYHGESRKLYVKGYVSKPQLQADQFAVQAAKTDLQVARVRLRLLDNLTKPVRLARIQSALVAAKARLLSVELSNKLDQKMLAEIQEQIDKCVIRAPVAGSVVLAHLYHDNHAHMVEPGEKTYRNRVLVRLPDSRHMLVSTKVSEDKIAFVRKGLPVAISFEAFPGVELPGRVMRVNEYPEPEGWLASGVKQYQAEVSIEKNFEGLRPLLTADLRVRVERLDDELQLPCQAVFEHGQKNYCICRDGHHWQAREVSIGPNNGKTVVIRRGLEEGDKVVLASSTYRRKVALPKLRNQPDTNRAVAYHDPRSSSRGE